jgi:ABC-2 type transport system permease protein
MIRLHAVWAVLWRNVQSYFSGVLGYLVIVVFVTVAAFCAFSPRFFANNLANLDQLSHVFPLLLLAVVPAITMATWADERRQGTDEILFTLPMTDLEILIGKYLAVLTVYSVVLAFSLTQLIALAVIGDPDWGVIFTTYLGYWLAGAGLLSVGMFASVLASSTTVAYVLGATFCAVPVLIGEVAPTSDFFQSLSIGGQLRDFTLGVIPLLGVFYFISLTLFMLYLNLIMISKRHWASNQQALMGLQFFTRAISMGLSLIFLGFILSRTTAGYYSRFDATEEGLYTLSPTTTEVIQQAVKEDRTVTIQAFVSPEVPREYVDARERLLGLLKQYDVIGKQHLEVRIVEVKPASKNIEEAKELEIKPMRHSGEIAGKLIEQDVYLGAVVTSNLGEVRIPFFDGESSIEYELTRSIATVTTSEERLKVGVFVTDMLRLKETRMFRGFDRMLADLGQQFELIDISAEKLNELVAEALEKKANESDKGQTNETDTAATKEGSSEGADSPEKEKELTEKEKKEKARQEKLKAKSRPDVLLVMQPSSLTRPQLDQLTSYIELGKPVLLMDDPLPFYPFTYFQAEEFGVVNAPRQERPTPDAPFSWVSAAPEVEMSIETQMQLRQLQQQVPPQFVQQAMAQFFQEHPEARPRYEPKGDMARLLRTIGIEWDNGQSVWDSTQPFADFSPAWPKEVYGDAWPKSFGPQENAILFVHSTAQFNSMQKLTQVSKNLKGTSEAVEQVVKEAEEKFGNGDQPTSPISFGMTDLMFIYPGNVTPAPNADTEFIPLLRTSQHSGRLNWDELTIEGELCRFTNHPLRTINERPQMVEDSMRHALAVQLKSKSAAKDKSAAGATPRINVVFIADTDFVSDLYYEQQEKLDKPLDNIRLLYNAIEVLSGDDRFVALRGRRPRPHRLDLVQNRIESYRALTTEAKTKKEKEIAEKLEEAKTRVKQAASKIEENKELGIMEKFQQKDIAASSEQRRFNAQKRRLDEELEETVTELKTTELQNIEWLQSLVRWSAIVLPALPALFLGCVVLIIRVLGENSRIIDSRRR